MALGYAGYADGNYFSAWPWELNRSPPHADLCWRVRQLPTSYFVPMQSMKVILVLAVATPLAAAWQLPLAGAGRLAINSRAAQSVMLFGRAPVPEPEPVTLQSALKSVGATYCALSRPVKVATVLAASAVVLLAVLFAPSNSRA